MPYAKEDDKLTTAEMATPIKMFPFPEWESHPSQLKSSREHFSLVSAPEAWDEEPPERAQPSLEDSAALHMRSAHKNHAVG